MEYMSSGVYLQFQMINSLCSIFNPDEVIQSFNYSNGTKGTIKRKSNKVSQIIDTHIEEHSKKPAIVRDKIVELVGDMPRIELFARQTVDGWDCWGNEV